MSLADRTKYVPFGNGTEGDAWTSAWCQHCAHDHSMHDDPGEGPGCPIIFDSMLHAPDWRWPEAWLPEPDDGEFYLPSRLVCLHFEACGACGGDPGATERAQRVVEVTEYWRREANRG